MTNRDDRQLLERSDRRMAGIEAETPPPPPWRRAGVKPGGPSLSFGSLFSATRFVVAGAIVALVGGFLLSGVLTQQPSDDPAPAARSPSATSDLLSTLVTTTVAPGVYRVRGDGVRPMSAVDGVLTMATEQWSSEFRNGVVAATDGNVWLFRSSGLFRLGDERTYPARQLPELTTDVSLSEDGTPTLSRRDPSSESWYSRTDNPARIVATDIGPDGTLWARPDPEGLSDPLARLDADGWTLFDADDGLPGLNSLAPWGTFPSIAVSPDGSVWTTVNDCRGGLGRFDGVGWTSYLADTHLCIMSLDVAPDGTVWFQAADGDALPTNQMIETYAIRPDAPGFAADPAPSTPDTLAAADEAPTFSDLQPSVELLTVEVEPGVFRVASDGVRDIAWHSWVWDQPEVVTTDGDVWLVLGEAALRLGDPVEYGVDARADLPHEISVTGLSTVELVPADHAYPTWAPALSGNTKGSYGRNYVVGPGQIAWERPGGLRLLRHTPDGTDEFTADDGIPVFRGISPVVGLRTLVAPDGAAWFSLYDQSKRNPVAPSDCGGLVRYDGKVSTYFLQDRGFCVAGLDVDAHGRVWVLGWSHVLADEPREDGSSWDDGPTQLFVIGPEAVAATNASGTDLDRQDRESDMDQRMSPRATAVAAMSLATALAAATAPAVTAQEPQPAMSAFSGRLGCGTAVPSAESVAWRFGVVDISDERFAGSYTNQLAGYEDGDSDVDGIGAYSALWEITNEGGGWVGQTASFRFAPESYSTFSMRLDGQGGYEGLTAVMEGDFTEDCGFDIRGVVVDGDLPATPGTIAANE